MTDYAIGDIQGCYDRLRDVLAKVDFSPSRDRLWVAGDLINRGPSSLETLRYIESLGDAAVVVLAATARSARIPCMTFWTHPITTG